MKQSRPNWWMVGLALAIGVAVLSPLASPHPDGLERVAEDQGFLDRARDAYFNIMPDYTFPGIANERLSTIAAGVVGTLLMFVLAYGLGWLLRRRAQQAAASPQAPPKGS